MSSSQLAFKEAVKRMMDEGHTIDVIYLDFAKEFGFGDIAVG